MKPESRLEIVTPAKAVHPARHRCGWAPAFAGVTKIIFVAVAMTGCAKHDVRETAAATRVHCTAGPLPASFGALPWLLYACDDGRSVALVSAPGNPAAPF